MARSEPQLRVATLDDETAVGLLMTESAAVLFPRFYNPQEAASAVRYVAQLDPMLLTDGTYFVLEHDGELIACGGWSRRDKGFRQLALVATLPGLPLYLACGFRAVEDVDVVMPDGVTIACVAMEKPIET